jgi:hypothetical protein
VPDLESRSRAELIALILELRQEIERLERSVSTFKSSQPTG